MRESKAHRCACTIERKIAALLPERYRKASLKDFHGDTLASVVAWLHKPTDGLFVTGPVGTGKTHLAAATIRRLTESNIDATFKRCAQFYEDIREMFRLNNSESFMLSLLERTRILILDDLGAGSLSDCERRFTLEILDRRMNRLRPTVVTSNWSLKNIAEKMDDRIASRLSAFTGIELSGQDLRLRRAS
jgi:DNA replication protein DnaC